MLLVEARAKINWTLDITGVRADGYHELDMLMQSVALSDTLMVEPCESLLLRLSTGAPVPANENNLVLKAANALLGATGRRDGALLTLRKRIPVGAGMGGGSADAAAALVGLNHFWHTGLRRAALMEIGQTVGADVPFMIAGGLARVSGVGEKIAPLSRARSYPLVVVQPCKGLSTRIVYAAYDERAADDACRPDNELAVRALEAGELEKLCRSMGNALQPVALPLRPAIGDAIQALERQGALRAMMTGSGSAVYGVFGDHASARAAFDALRTRWRRVYLTRTAEEGIIAREQ